MTAREPVPLGLALARALLALPALEVTTLLFAVVAYRLGSGHGPWPTAAALLQLLAFVVPAGLVAAPLAASTEWVGERRGLLAGAAVAFCGAPLVLLAGQYGVRFSTGTAPPVEVVGAIAGDLSLGNLVLDGLFLASAAVWLAAARLSAQGPWSSRSGLLALLIATALAWSVVPLAWDLYPVTLPSSGTNVARSPEVVFDLAVKACPLEVRRPIGGGFQVVIEGARAPAFALLLALGHALVVPFGWPLADRLARRLLAALGGELPPAEVPAAPRALTRAELLPLLRAMALTFAAGLVCLAAARALPTWLARRQVETLRARASTGDPAAMRELAHALGYHLRDDAEVHGLLEAAARAGDVDAMYSLGWAHQRGCWGVPRDDRLALEWYRRAADAKHRTAPALFEALARDRPDLPRARAWLESELARLEAAAPGRAWNRIELARTLLLLGRRTRAIAVLREVAGQEQVAMLELARALEGEPGGAEEAARCYRAIMAAPRSALSGAEASYRLGVLHEDGHGVAPDRGEALALYRRALELNPDHRETLAALERLEGR